MTKPAAGLRAAPVLPAVGPMSTAAPDAGVDVDVAEVAVAPAIGWRGDAPRDATTTASCSRGDSRRCSVPERWHIVERQIQPHEFGPALV